MKDAGSQTNRDLLLAYFLPYVAYVGAAALLAGRVPREVDYAIRLAATGGLLLAMRGRYTAFRGPGSAGSSIAWGLGAGLFGVLLWIALLLPFRGATAGDPWEPGAFCLRLAAACLVVPFAEELLCRGYLLGVFTQWQGARARGAEDPLGDALDRSSLADLAPGAYTVPAVLVSSIAFALGHAPEQMLAAFAYGVLMAALWIARKDLLAPIVAHAATNLALYVYVFLSGSWGLW